MVLSEDDYLDFLTPISQDTSQESPILPWYLRKALTQSSLFLLGYRLRDWGFRTLFRGIVNTTPLGLRQFSLAIQLDPKVQKGIVSTDQVREYLEKYFGSSLFTVEWGTSHEFIMEGERNTHIFAEVLGILDLPVAEQRAVVKRNKDRIKKTIQRHMKPSDLRC